MKSQNINLTRKEDIRKGKLTIVSPKHGYIRLVSCSAQKSAFVYPTLPYKIDKNYRGKGFPASLFFRYENLQNYHDA